MTKTLKTILLILLAVAIATGAVVGIIYLSKSANPSNPGDIGANSFDGLIVTDDETDSALTIKLTKIIVPISSEPVSSGNHLSYKITAELTPATTTDKLDLTAKWENPFSAWAAGKSLSDYFNLQHDDGTYVAIATALVPFGEPIILTGKIRNREITKSIKLDYLAKPTTLNGDNAIVLDNYSANCQLSMTDRDYALGSVKPSGLSGSLTITLADYIYNALKGNYNIQKSVTYDCNLIDLISPATLSFKITDFLTSSSGVNQTQLQKELYSALMSDTGTDTDCYVEVATVSFSGDYSAMVNGVPTKCGTFKSATVVLQLRSFTDLSMPATDVDLGGDILFYLL